MGGQATRKLSPETVQGTSLPLQGIDNIHGSNSLPLGVLGVGNSIPDHILQEHLQDTPGLLIDQSRDSLHATPPGQTTNGRLRDALDVISQDLPVPLGASLSKTFASLASTSHVALVSGFK